MYLTIIPLPRVGYEMNGSQRGLSVELAIISYMSKKREWDNCFIRNNQEILLYLADYTLKQQPEDNWMVANSLAWFNGSYIMAA